MAVRNVKNVTISPPGSKLSGNLPIRLWRKDSSSPYDAAAAIGLFNKKKLSRVKKGEKYVLLTTTVQFKEK